MHNENKMNYILGKESFRKFYRSLTDTERRTIFIIVGTSDGQEVYLTEYKQWLSFGDYISQTGSRIDKISLQYRSHVVPIDTSNSDGVYLVKTAKGQMGGATKDCYSVGIVKGNKVYRQLYITPELIKDIEFEDDLNCCIEEALILHEQKAKTI